MAAYRVELSGHLLPHFKNHRLSEITVAEVDRYRQAKVQERDALRAMPADERPHRPLSNASINKTLDRLGQILDVAVEYGHLPTNPVRVNPKNRKLKADKPERSYLDSAAQITALLDAARELDAEAPAHRQHVPRHGILATLTFGGLRIGELLGLRWRDVDLANGWLTVGEAKTDAGVRRVKIRPVLRDVLGAHKANVNGGVSPDALVFGTSNGRRQSASNVRNRILTGAWKRANAKRAEDGEPPLPKLTPHSLRRTFASVLFAIGVPHPTIMRELGHTEVSLTLNIYAQAMDREEGENERLRSLVEGVELPVPEPVREKVTR